jgi:hypothetical protein
MPKLKWSCRKFKNDFIIRSPGQVQDIAKVYGNEKNALAIRLVPELVENAKKTRAFLETILRADELDELLKSINKNRVRAMLRDVVRILRRM